MDRSTTARHEPSLAVESLGFPYSVRLRHRLCALIVPCARQVPRRLDLLRPIQLLVLEGIKIDAVESADLEERVSPSDNQSGLISPSMRTECEPGGEAGGREEARRRTLIPKPSNLGFMASLKSMPMLAPHLGQNSWSFCLVLKRYLDRRASESPCHCTFSRSGSLSGAGVGRSPSCQPGGHHHRIFFWCFFLHGAHTHTHPSPLTPLYTHSVVFFLSLSSFLVSSLLFFLLISLLW